MRRAEVGFSAGYAYRPLPARNYTDSLWAFGAYFDAVLFDGTHDI